MEIDDKTFAQVMSELDSYLLDDCLTECVERSIVALNRYRNQTEIPILIGVIEKSTDEDIKTVKDKIEKLNKEYKDDKWIN